MLSINNTCNHECSRCGECCCSYLPITKAELKEIKTYVETFHIPAEPFTDSNGTTYAGICPFYNRKKHLCNIYPVRPAVCRSYRCDLPEPILEHNRKFYAARADYNGVDRNLKTLWDLVYNNPFAIVFIGISMGYNTPKKLKRFLRVSHNKDLNNVVDYLNRVTHGKIFEGHTLVGLNEKGGD